ncbi:GNAT family N-acetyltransferase [Alloiococcus sp. CFN-8]|uniref:GNAT family N-acetyltransferase n=1 Tax=Alloiococcus sp. CFN-8 TaxID=3416081 RepID=UPI003CF02099
MITLKEIDENNWLQVARLKVSEEQKGFVASPMGILARGYVYRNCRARVFAIASDKAIIGITMVRDLDEEPTCYELQQLMIDAGFQGNGYGTDALKKILNILKDERKYSSVEVCVNKNDFAALHLYKKVGFQDTGYISEDVPDCYNLRYSL